MATTTWNSSFEATPAGTDAVSGGDDRIRELKEAIRQNLHEGKFIYVDGAGSANSYTATLAPASDTLVEGNVVIFKSAAANTGASTLNVNSLGAKNILKNRDQALASGDIEDNQVIMVVYDGTSYQMVSQLAHGEGGSVTAHLIPGTANTYTLGNATYEFADVFIGDNAHVQFGSDQDVLIGWNTTRTGLDIAATEGAALALYLSADEGDDAGDEWKLNVADGGTITLGNDINSAGTFVTHLTITPNSTVASSTVAFAGHITVAGTLTASGPVVLDGGAFTFNDTGADLDFRAETADNAYMLYLDGAKNAVVLGANTDVSSADNIVLIDSVARTASATVDFAHLKIASSNAVTIPSGTTALAAGLHIAVPNWTATGTITASASLYIAGAATEATTDYALWVDGGTSRFDGAVEMENAAGPTLLNEAATGTNPTLVPNKADPNTGLAWYAADSPSLVAGGTEVMRSSSGLGMTFTQNISKTAQTTASPFILITEAASDTNPVYCFMGESDTGIGWQSDTIHLIGGGISEGSVGVAGTVFNDAGNDRNFRIESNDNANAFVIDGGTNFVGFGAAASTSVNYFIARSKAYTAAVDGDEYIAYIQSNSTAITTAGSGTHGVIATLGLNEPDITIGTAGVTNAATLLINNVATEATNNYALWVNAGNSRFDGTLIFDTASLSQMTFKGGQTIGDNPSATHQAQFRLGNSTSGGSWHFLLGATAYSALHLKQTGDGPGLTVFNDDGIDRDFRVESSGNANMLFIDGGNDTVGIGGTAYSASCALTVTGTSRSVGTAREVLTIMDNTGLADANGGGILFGGIFTGSSLTEGAGIWAEKENATNAQYGFELKLGTRPNGGNITTAITMTSAQQVIFDAGVLFVKEIATPTAIADHGALYTKTDNKLYFQDGAGSEHEVSFA